MKDLEVTIRLYNNQLRQRRRKLGLTQRELAVAAGVPIGRYGPLEAMRESPLKADGGWTKPALVLAAFHCVPPQRLFPQALCGISNPTASRFVNVNELHSLLSTHQERCLLPPDEAMMRIDEVSALEQAMARLTVHEAEVIAARFGLGQEQSTLKEVAKQLGTRAEHVRHVESRALRRLRYAMCKSD